MATIKNIDVRKGMVIVGKDGDLYQCLDRDLNTPGNWRAILNLKLKNLKTGVITDQRVRPDDKHDLAYLESRDMQYLYRDGDDFVFMDPETFEQMTLPASIYEEAMKFLKENDNAKIVMHEGRAIDLELPASVELKVIETEPSIKGATAAAQTKPAVLETGVEVKVPAFVNEGDVIKVDPKEKKYLSRA